MLLDVHTHSHLPHTNCTFNNGANTTQGNTMLQVTYKLIKLFLTLANTCLKTKNKYT